MITIVHWCVPEVSCGLGKDSYHHLTEPSLSITGASLLPQTVKNPPSGELIDPGVGKTPWRREWLSTPVFWLGEFHGQRSPAGYSPWDHKRSQTLLSDFLFHSLWLRLLPFWLEPQTLLCLWYEMKILGLVNSIGVRGRMFPICSSLQKPYSVQEHIYFFVNGINL